MAAAETGGGPREAFAPYISSGLKHWVKSRGGNIKLESAPSRASALAELDEAPITLSPDTLDRVLNSSLGYIAEHSA
jgi:hypothetical protein